MRTRTRTKIITGIIAMILSCVLLFTVIVVNNNTNQVVGAATRTVELSASTIDAQSILNEFDDAKLTKKGTTTYFEGYKALDTDKLSEIDYISEDDFSELEECTVKYNFSYDSETNIVTLAACATLPDGTIEIEELYGIAFTNENGEIDAIIDLDGECILLSEMRSIGMIENCGWFSSLFKKVVVAVVAVVAVTAAAAVIAVTAGAGLGAVIAVGAVVGAVAGGIAGGVISYSEYGKLDWRWVAGGAVIGAALGAAVGWGVGTAMGAGASQAGKLPDLMNAAKNGKLKYSNTLINKGYINPNSSSYRPYVDNYSLIIQEIMKAKNYTIESGTGYFKWVVEGAIGGTLGVWELVIDPVGQMIMHFLFKT